MKQMRSHLRQQQPRLVVVGRQHLPQQLHSVALAVGCPEERIELHSGASILRRQKQKHRTHNHWLSLHACACFNNNIARNAMRTKKNFVAPGRRPPQPQPPKTRWSTDNTTLQPRNATNNVTRKGGHCNK